MIALESTDADATVTALGPGWSLATPWTAVVLRRRGRRVTIEGRVTGTGGAANPLFTLAVGWRPDLSAVSGDAITWIADGGAGAGPVRAAISNAGVVSLSSAVAVAGMGLHVEFDAALP